MHKIVRQRNRHRLHIAVNIVVGLAAVGLFGATGLKLMEGSSAISVIPYGSIDYCVLENNQTVIYGWANDANATSLTQPSVTVNVGVNSLTVNTSLAGFRDTPINNYIDNTYPGDPKPGTYGIRAVFGNAFKGNRYAISATAINVGPGNDASMYVNPSGSSDGVARQTFAGNIVPDACLADMIAPVPTPVPTNPSPPPGSLPVPKPAAPISPRPAPALPPSPAPATSPSVTADADATIIAGTYGVIVKIPAGKAVKAWIEYGTDVAVISTKSPEIAVTGTEATLEVRDLKPQLLYGYRIVRQAADGTTSTSPVASFMTEGLDVRIQMYAGNKPVEGISGQLPGRSARISDSKGTVTFNDILPGNQKFRYTYRGAKLTKDIQVVAAGPSASKPASSIDVFTYRLNLPTVASVNQGSSSSPFPWLFAAAVAGGFAVLAALVFIIIRLRGRRPAGTSDYDSEPETTAAYTPMQAEVETENMGKSLRQMVIEGMAEEARRRKFGDTPPPMQPVEPMQPGDKPKPPKTRA